ncbi:hypothetical protein CI109_102339 [Kwoniella shandongensis]|uniref:Uncharacterized protein n=1 Tax=Kwoniella shandongensis TaxID=1734106 RepID=A0A5M6C3J7_9TREE|nr:uncharacterized protein CI109_003342 [Kwoniella shandongensis]KAA5528442.1 hypothetical protein CI109_003342 [Kwoniella shandongensis]
MLSRNKRPTVSASSSKPFNPAHTHPASISSTPSIQSKIHVSTALPDEAAQSGGGGGGGVGAGSEEGMTLVVEKDKGKTGGESKEEDSSKWSDVKKVHPAWEGFGKGPGKNEGDKGGEKAKL